MSEARARRVRRVRLRGSIRPGSITPKGMAIVALLLAGLVLLPGAALFIALDRPEIIQGVVVAVTSRPPLTVDTFDLLADDGRRLTFTIGPLDLGPGGFDAPHLVSHQATGQPVIVSYRRQGASLVAVRLADGPSFAASPSAAGGLDPHSAARTW